MSVRRGVKIYTIGVGNRLRSDLNESALKQVASITGGRYFRAHNVSELQQIYALLDQLEPVERDTQSYRPTWSLFYWPLAIALMLASLLALPAIAYFCYQLLGIQHTEYLPALILLSSPSATITFILAREMKGDPDFAVTAISTSTILSAVTFVFWLNL